MVVQLLCVLFVLVQIEVSPLNKKIRLTIVKENVLEK